MQDVLFYLLAGCIVGAGFLTVTLKNLLHAALALMATLFTTAGLFLMLKAEFIAIAQVLVYIGGVVIFILYAVLLTHKLGEESISPGKLKTLGASILAMGFFAFLYSRIAPFAKSYQSNTEGTTTSLQDLGIRLLSAGSEGFLVPFEWISLLLLAALIGAITLARNVNDKAQKGNAP